MKSMKFAAIGDNCVDLYISTGYYFPGGGPVNFAVHSRRLGIESSYIGVIGNDEKGRAIKDALMAEKVDVSFLLTADGPTAEARVKLVNGDRIFCGSDRGVRGQLKVTDEIMNFISQHTLVHTTLDGNVDDDLKKFKNAGLMVSYDYSHRYTQEQLVKTINHVDYGFFSGVHYNFEEAEKKLRQLRSYYGERVLVMTLGERGSMVFCDGKLYYQEAIKIQAMDTLGAGDAYIAAFLVSVLSGDSIETGMKKASEYAAGVCTYNGAFGYGRRISGADICDAEGSKRQ